MKIAGRDVASQEKTAVQAAFIDLWTPLQSEVDQFWATTGPTVPDGPLYHYTTAAGLKGIVYSGGIYLTDAFYLSDKTELHYGRDLIAEVLAESARSSSGELREFLAERMGQFDPFTGDLQASFYVASFCERPDLLSQWRTYGGAGAGFALGFPADTFMHTERFATFAATPARFHRIEYSRETQRKIIAFVIRRCSEMLAADLSSARTAHERRVIQGGYYALSILQLAGLLPQFKHPMFAEEREWRLTLPRLPYEEVKGLEFRATGRDLVPYYLCSIRLTESGLLPLSEIVVAPANEPALQASTMKKFMQKVQYPEGSVKIVEPEIPLQFR